MGDTTKSATSSAVYQQLKEQILHLDLPPGSAISEIDTASQYNVSRTPVRDAFKALEMEGLLEIQPHVGTFVSLINLNEISDILYMREVLEQAVLKDLSMHFTQSHLLQFNIILEHQKTLLASDLDGLTLGKEFIKTDNEFHSSLFELAGKQNIWHFLSMVNQQYERFRTFINRTGKESLESLYEEHCVILDAISNKDLDRLSKTITNHIYGGFNRSSSVIYNYPSYFKTLK